MEAPRIPSVFRGVQKKPRGFNFTPRYYDADKEDLQRRIKFIEKAYAAEQQESEISKARLQMSMERKWRGNRAPISDNTRGRRLMLILGGLVSTFWLIYKYLLA